MKRLHLLFVIAIFCIASCQKDLPNQNIVPDVPITGTDSSSGGLLKKEVYTYFPDNLDWYILEYQYDTSRRLLFITATFKRKETNGTITTTAGTTRFFRDSIGRIIRIGSQPDTASFNYVIHYENAVSNKMSSFLNVQKTGMVTTVKDSTAFEYNTDNRIVKCNNYSRMPNNSYQMLWYEQYQYDSRGNITKKETFIDEQQNGNFVFNIGYVWQYDNNINPRYQDELALFEWRDGWPDYGSPNNEIYQFNIYAGNQFDDGNGVSYQYDTSGKPVSGTKMSISNGVTQYDTDNIFRYYYY